MAGRWMFSAGSASRKAKGHPSKSCMIHCTKSAGGAPMTVSPPLPSLSSRQQRFSDPGSSLQTLLVHHLPVVDTRASDQDTLMSGLRSSLTQSAESPLPTSIAGMSSCCFDQLLDVREPAQGPAACGIDINHNCNSITDNNNNNRSAGNTAAPSLGEKHSVLKVCLKFGSGRPSAPTSATCATGTIRQRSNDGPILLGTNAKARHAAIVAKQPRRFPSLRKVSKRAAESAAAAAEAVNAASVNSTPETLFIHNLREDAEYFHGKLLSEDGRVDPVSLAVSLTSVGYLAQARAASGLDRMMSSDNDLFVVVRDCGLGGPAARPVDILVDLSLTAKLVGSLQLGSGPQDGQKLQAWVDAADASLGVVPPIFVGTQEHLRACVQQVCASTMDSVEPVLAMWSSAWE